MMRNLVCVVLVFVLGGTALAQDQQLGARTKAMGGSYTAFEDDPVSVWLNPAGIATQVDQMSMAYQTYVGYPVRQKRGAGDTITTETEAETTLVDPALLPAFLGAVFQVGSTDAPMAVGICYARPYHLNYALDQVTDPAQTTFKPEANVEQSLARFRVALARDFRFQPAGESGMFTHLAVGLGVDVSYETWEFSTSTGDTSDTATAMGFGGGLLLGLYNSDSFRVNFGVAYQSAVHYDFSIEPTIQPAFDMPQQLNAGTTFYLLEGTPLRMTVDVQWIEWSETAEEPLIGNHPEFEDALNFSVGFEYRLKAPAWFSEKITLYPRLGFRRFDAPWDDPDDLPMTAAFKLVLDTDEEVFNILTFGLGFSWQTADDKARSIDIAGDIGGDAFNLAVGYTHEF